MENEQHSAASRLEHRLLGHYLAVQTWSRGFDGTVLQDEDLKKFLVLKNIKQVRADQLREDLSPWFPKQKIFTKKHSSSWSFHSLYLSRVDISKLPWRSLTTKAQIEEIRKLPVGSPKIGMFDLPSKDEVISYLALLDAGIINPRRNRKVTIIKDGDDDTPLHEAVKQGKIEIVEWLIDNEADVNAKGGACFYGATGMTPLHCAVECNNIEVVKLLLNHGADVNAKNNCEWTPLVHAIHKGNIEMVKYLVANGADVNTQDVDGLAPLDSSFWKGKNGTEIRKFLVAQGAVSRKGRN